VASAVALSLSALISVWGCSSSTEPDGGDDVTFRFTPTAPDHDLFVGASLAFSATATSDVATEVSWFAGGQEVGDQATYTYMATTVGDDTLSVTISGGGHVSTHHWYLVISQDPSLVPPIVSVVAIRDGPEPADVIIEWLGINSATYPIVQYEVAINYDEPVTVDTWDTSILLDAFPHGSGQLGYVETLGGEEYGLIPGAHCWLGIRALDDRGQRSDIDEIFQHTITFPWYMEGVVYDASGQVLPNIIVEYGCPECRTNTDQDGFYRFGPFRNIDTVSVNTITSDSPPGGEPYDSWYDYYSPPLTWETGAVHDITLIPRYEVDEACDIYDGDFRHYLRLMTSTVHPTDLRPNTRLYKWENYPISVYLPEYVSDTGVDYEATVRWVLDIWNTNLGESFLVETADSLAADIVFTYVPSSPGFLGQTSISAPTDQPYSPGEVIPEKMEIKLLTTIVSEQRTAEVAMHELGHALGAYDHSFCSQAGYLMYIVSSGVLNDGPENAIHPDELHLIKAVRYLQQGVDVSLFEEE